ncbi:MAG: 6-bladed beta-propeller, partial [Magnetococcales bacterium]|nr:6-bladed beta-propeller [Magnetococcales bacterium]
WFGKPFGVAAFQGRVYVGDTVNRTVLLLDPAKGRAREIGKEDPGGLLKPMGMNLDGKGNLYVMDGTKKLVNVYDGDGKYLRSMGGPDLFEHPSSVAVNPDGTRVFALDTGSAQGKPENHRLQVFDGLSGKYLFAIGKRGREDGEFNLARDVAVGPDGLVYVVDGGNFRVQSFTQEGKFVRAFGSVGRRLGQFARPKGIAIDKENNLYVSDASHANFQIFNREGQLLMFVGTRGNDTERAKYLLPAMISLDEDGRVYMVDQGFRKVDVFRPARLKEDEGSLGKAFKTLATLKPKE